jgi:hypothetical protein
MKIADLEKAQADGVTVAYSAYGSIDSDFAVEVRVINPRAVRYVPDRGRSWSPSSHKSHGCEIEFVSGRSPGRETVALTKLVGTWETYSELVRSRQTRKASVELLRNNSQTQAQKLAASLESRVRDAGSKPAYNDIEVVGIGGYSGGGHYQAPYAYGVRVSNGILEKLLAGEI